MNAPGTTPIGDIVDYRLSVYGDEVDEMIRRLATYTRQFPREIDELMWQCWPHWTSQPREISSLRIALARELWHRDAAKVLGWSGS
jgi:hypothetical protein